MSGMDQNDTASWVHIPKSAVEAARKMLDPACTESFVALDRQFTEAMSCFGKDYYLDIDFDAGNLPWNCSGLSVKDYFIVFDASDNIVALIGKEDVLHEEDIFSILRDAGIAPTKNSIQKICSSLLGYIPQGSTLRTIFQNASEAANTSPRENVRSSLSEKIQSVSNVPDARTVNQTSTCVLEPER